MIDSAFHSYHARLDVLPRPADAPPVCVRVGHVHGHTRVGCLVLVHFGLGAWVWMDAGRGGLLGAARAAAGRRGAEGGGRRGRRGRKG